MTCTQCNWPAAHIRNGLPFCDEHVGKSICAECGQPASRFCDQAIGFVEDEKSKSTFRKKPARILICSRPLCKTCVHPKGIVHYCGRRSGKRSGCTTDTIDSCSAHHEADDMAILEHALYTEQQARAILTGLQRQQLHLFHA